MAAAAVTAGCASSPPAEDPRQPEQTTPTATATEAQLELVRVAGTVVSGAERGCLLLNTETRRYHLTGGDSETTLEPGQEVTVTGLADMSTTSSCEQTIPLTVSEVDPAD
jgi:hypothetical protein